MKNRNIFKVITLFCVTVIVVSGCSRRNDISPPVAQKVAKKLELHGTKRIDNYYWLNERDNPAVLEYLHAENAYRDAVMASSADLQESLYKEITDRIKPECNTCKPTLEKD